MPYTSIADVSFQDVVNLWITNPTAAEFTTISNNPFYGPIQQWDTQLVTDMSNAFYLQSSFNDDISLWNTSNVTNMYRMFSGANNFNQPLNNWDVGNVTDMNSMFLLALAFNKPLNNWNVGNVTNMDLMFSNTDVFNQPLNNWNVGNVTTMASMFSYATAFNQPLFHWDVSNVTTFEEMFKVATTFDQYIRSWDVSSSAILTNMFAGSYTGNQCPLATDKSLWNKENNTDTGDQPPGPTPTVNGYFNQDLSGSYAPYYSYNYLQHPNQIIIVTQPGSPTGAGLYTLSSVTPSEIPTSVTIDETTGTLTISTANILGCKSNQIYTINITENTSPASTSIIIVNIKNTPREPNAFPFPLEQKNKSLHGVNQKLDPGTARPNYFITRSQFNPARFRSKQSNLSNPSLCFF